MKILAFDFSSSLRSVAVVVVEDKGADSASGMPGKPGVRVTGRALGKGAKRTDAFELIESALGQAGVKRGEIECLAVGLGPGSYMGIRAALAVAQGWQLALGVRVVGVSSVECVAAQLAADGISGSCSVIVDAQRREFYRADYELVGGASHEKGGLRLVGLEALRLAAEAGERLAGPEARLWFPSAQDCYPDAGMLGMLAASRSENVPAETLEPIYLREVSYVKAPQPRIFPSKPD